MPARSLLVAGSAALALALTGCGSSSGSPTTATHTTAAPTTTSSAASTSTTATDTTTAPRRRRPQPTPTTASSTSSRSAASTTSSTPATVRTAPSPVPAATPAAPDGLSQTTGYSTYELCSSGCSGAVPGSLRRALHLPSAGSGSACPVSAGSSPVTPSGGGDLTVSSFIGSAWQGARVTWTAASSYTGPVLIRGRQLGGSGAVGFGEGHVPYDELQLLAAGAGAPAGSGGGRAWLSVTRVRSPGCYADQVDGTSFSTVIVFRATG